LLTSAEARVLLGSIGREALRKRVLSGSVSPCATTPI
jgi:hypothetical protein